VYGADIAASGYGELWVRLAGPAESPRFAKIRQRPAFSAFTLGQERIFWNTRIVVDYGGQWLSAHVGFSCSMILISA
jgi:hypothetical protein